MLLAHRVGAVPPALGAEVGRALSPADLQEFIHRVRSGHENAAIDFVEELVRDGVTVEAVFLDMLAPAARFLGEEWERDNCDFVEVTIALGRMQRVLRTFSSIEPLDATGVTGRVLLSCPPGEQHSLGLLIVAEFFVRAGWSVSIGTPVGDFDLERTVAGEWFDIVGFSISCETRLPHLKREMVRVRQRSRNPGVRVLVGGPCLLLDPGLSSRLGSDGWAADGVGAVQLATNLLGSALA